MAKRSTQWHEILREDVLSNEESRAEYNAFKLQLDLAQQLKKARQQFHLTQELVAERMHTQKTVVARIEAAGGKGKHSPSIKTLVKYANAINCDIKIKLVPKKTQE